jgi:hypothetical protein
VQTYLNSDEDMQWFFDVHLKGIYRPSWVKAIALFGNEDCPDKAELYAGVKVDDLRFTVVFPK